MRLVRYVIPALASLCLVSQPLSAQGGATGTVHGQVTDSVTKQGLPSAKALRPEAAANVSRPNFRARLNGVARRRWVTPGPRPWGRRWIY